MSENSETPVQGKGNREEQCLMRLPVAGIVDSRIPFLLRTWLSPYHPNPSAGDPQAYIQPEPGFPSTIRYGTVHSGDHPGSEDLAVPHIVHPVSGSSPISRPVGPVTMLQLIEHYAQSPELRVESPIPGNPVYPP